MPDGGFDPRITPARGDIAAAHLEGHVDAEKYVTGELRQIVTGRASMREAPDSHARQGSEMLYGEPFMIYEEKDGWAWGQSQADGYMGYVEAGNIGLVSGPPDHEVAALRTYMFPEPDLKTPPLDILHMTSRLTVEGADGDYSKVAGGGWVFTRHLVSVSEVDPDFVGTARKFMGAPYFWGGRSSFGLDCSALVQLSLARAGRTVPRDSDMQEANLGEKIDIDPLKTERGDLLYCAGHVVISLGDGWIVHANGHHMAVAEEPLQDCMTRFDALGLNFRTIRRI